jgi:16S rRNA U516 pseudouridylate synthase RsuA-like enzyme
MTAAVGHPTLRLVRSRIGTLNLAGLQPGMFRSLTPQEVEALYATLGVSAEIHRNVRT